MLEAEGLIPDGTDWPQGFDGLNWQAGKFDYSLRRNRLDGAKGPRKAFVEVDWFCLRQELTQRVSVTEWNVARKAKELKNLIYIHSQQGMAEGAERWNRYWASVNDAKFQAFKATIPGLVAPKRGRPRNAAQRQGAAA